MLIATPLLALGLLLVRQQSLGAPAAVAMQAAAALYAGGDPALAQQAYSQLVEQGGGGPELAHNLGAAALRAGDLATAVAALEEAQRLAPRDEGVAAALATAREAQQGSAGVGPEGSQTSGEMAPGVAQAAEGTGSSAMALLERVQGEWLTANQVALGALGLWVAAGALVLAALAPGRWRMWALIALLPVSLGLGAALLILLM
jgi:tetratricopeptide (TPR) repeat protein